MATKILQGTVFDLAPTLAPGSIDCVVTSPPYWMLRSYLPKDHPLKAQELGQENTPADYVASLVKVFGLLRPALADHACCFINVGDTYSCTPRGNKTPGGGTLTNSNIGSEVEDARWEGGKIDKSDCGIDTGNLCLIPQRLMIALQDDGWIVRSIIVWHKPAPMPSSVAGWRWMRCRVKVKASKKPGYHPHRGDHDVEERNHTAPKSDKSLNAEWIDCPGCKKCKPNDGLVLRRGSWRPTSSYEPVIMLAKSQGYYADGEAVKQPAAAATVSRDQYTRMLDDPDEQFAVRHDHETICNGANLRDVWTISSEPLSEKHYAAYPTELVDRCLRAGTSAKGYCPKCGLPWARVIETKAVPHPKPRSFEAAQNRCSGTGQSVGGNQANGTAALAPEVSTIGWRPSCGCNQPPRSGVVLDPFSGSGRTGIVALRLGLDFVGFELNPEYAEMGRRLLREESPLFA